MPATPSRTRPRDSDAALLSSSARATGRAGAVAARVRGAIAERTPSGRERRASLRRETHVTRGSRPEDFREGSRLPRMAGLDGIRALAVTGVVLYHCGEGWLPGGFLGVDVFFVLSGFLITSLLLRQLEVTRALDLRDFYVRRARRLLPALMAMLVLAAALAATVAPDAAAGLRRDAPAALLYVANWQAILTDASYFEEIGRPELLQHLWSLAVEEQFYLIWPLVVWIAFRLRGRRAVGIAALTGVVLSSLAMVVGAVRWGMPESADPSRLYFGTDTHTMGVLLGAALAVVWRPGRIRRVIAPGAQAVVTGAGLAALGLLLWCFVHLGEYSTFLYRGGFLGVAVVSAVLVAAASHPGAPLGRLLGIPPLRWLGQRSYGIYLYHWPLFMVTRPGQDLPVDGPLVAAARIAVVLVIADLSYRFLELPVRQGRLGKALSVRWRAAGWRRPGVTASLAAGGLAVAVVFTGVRVITIPAPVLADNGSALIAQPDSTPAELMRPWPAPDAAFLIALAAGKPWATDEKARRAGDRRTRVSAFGESVMLGAAGALQHEGMKLDLQAKVGIQSDDLIRRVVTRAQAGKVHDRVIVHLGNNGIVSRTQLAGMLEALRDVRRAVLVTVHVPRPWMDVNNQRIHEAASSFSNVRLVDWAALSAGRDDLFARDGVHLTWKGATVYAAALRDAAGVA